MGPAISSDERVDRSRGRVARLDLEVTTALGTLPIRPDTTAIAPGSNSRLTALFHLDSVSLACES